MEANVIVGISIGSSLIITAAIAKVMDIRQRRKQEFMDRINGPKFKRPIVRPFKRVTVKKG